MLLQGLLTVILICCLCRHDGVNIIIIREQTEGEYTSLEHEVTSKLLHQHTGPGTYYLDAECVTYSTNSQQALFYEIACISDKRLTLWPSNYSKKNIQIKEYTVMIIVMFNQTILMSLVQYKRM